jgi:hypothetical protein
VGQDEVCRRSGPVHKATVEVSQVTVIAFIVKWAWLIAFIVKWARVIAFIVKWARLISLVEELFRLIRFIRLISEEVGQVDKV